jgi:hypothetical protein
MARSDKPMRISGYARDQLTFRGGSKEEVIEAIRTEPWRPADLGRLECHKDFVFNACWNRKCYVTKRVRPIFVEESDEIVVVTVYVYYS